MSIGDARDHLPAAVEDAAAFDAAVAEEGPNIPGERGEADLGWVIDVTSTTRGRDGILLADRSAKRGGQRGVRRVLGEQGRPVGHLQVVDAVHAVVGVHHPLAGGGRHPCPAHERTSADTAGRSESWLGLVRANRRGES